MLHRADRRRGPFLGRAAVTRDHRAVRWALAAALVVPVALGTGCGGAAPKAADEARLASAGETTPASRPDLVDGSQLRLPLDPYLLSPRESVWVARAYRILLAQCVTRFGLASPPERAGEAAGPATLNERRYGITDARLAAVAGYRVSAHEPAAVSPEPPTGSADPRMLTVLDGARDATVNGQRVPADGCTGEANRRLGAGAPAVADVFVAQRLSQDSYFASQRDPRVRTAIGAWSTCMHGRGYEYPSPLAAAADPRFVRGPVSATEITVAAVDIECKRHTNLVAVWSTVEAELQRPAVAANQKVLKDIRRTNEAQLRAARSLGLG